MRLLLTASAIWMFASVAACGQTADGEGAAAMGGYSSMDFDAGFFQSKLDGQIELMKDGVKIRLIPDNPSDKPLPISANQVTFTWPEKGNSPSQILLEGKVVIEHPQATIKSDKAEWDFQSGILTFTGNPVGTTPKVKELRAQKMVLNFKTGRFDVSGGVARNVLLGMGGGSSPSSPWLLREQDVLDWPAFLDKFKAEAAANSASPGKRIMSLLTSKSQNLIKSASQDTLLANKGAVLKELNGALGKPSMYDEAAWNNVHLSDAIKDLLKKKPASEEEAFRLNRRLLEAAYAGLIAEGSGQ